MEVKTREDVLAERKLRKAAKQSKKQSSTNKQGTDMSKHNAVDVNEVSERIGTLQMSNRKSGNPAFNESNMSNTTSQNIPNNNASKQVEVPIEISSKSDDKACNLGTNSQTVEATKSKAQLKAERRALQVYI